MFNILNIGFSKSRDVILTTYTLESHVRDQSEFDSAEKTFLCLPSNTARFA
jgi:hypothetical protein